MNLKALWRKLTGTMPAKVDAPRAAATPAGPIPTDQYFRLSGLIVAARATGQYEAAMLLARRAWAAIPGVLAGELADVDPREIPPIDAMLDLLVAAGDEPGLTELRRIVHGSERLAALRRTAVETAAHGLVRSRRILEVVAHHPGIIQKDLDELLELEPEVVREHCYWMAQLGRLERKKAGSSYALFPSSRPSTVALGEDGLPIVRLLCPGCRQAIEIRRASCGACGYDIRKIWWFDREGGADDDREDDVDYSLSIVGESYRQEALEAICGGRDTETARLKVTARLVLDDDNPHDNQAVKVTIHGHHVGYLSRGDARRYRAMPAGPAEVPALIVGGWDRGDRGVGHYGVRLALGLDGPQE